MVPIRHLSPPAREHLSVLTLYLLLSLLLTYPLLFNFATHVPGDGGDDPALAWNLWWVKHTSLNLKANPLYCDYMFYPIGLNLAFYTLTLLNGALSIPLQALFGLVSASNLVLLSSFTLSGYGAFLLVRYLLKAQSQFPVPRFAPFVAGLVYAFSSNKLLYASLGQFNIASSQWIPFYVLYLFRSGAVTGRLVKGGTGGGKRQSSTISYDRLPLRDAVLAGLFLVFQALSEFTFASFLLVFTLLYVVFWLILRGGFGSAALLPFWCNLAVIGVLFVCGLAPVLQAMIGEMLVEGDFFVRGLGFADVFSADLLGFFVPSRLHPLLGSLQGGFNFSYINFVYLGYVILALSLYALTRWQPRRGVTFWGVTTLLFVLISLGPTLRINGTEYRLPLPFTLFQQLPFFKGNRYPSRYSVMITLGLAVLVGYGVALLLRKLELRSRNRELGGREESKVSVSRSPLRFIVAALLLPLILFEHLSVPLPLSDLRVPQVYDVIAADPGHFSVLEVPLAWRNGFRITGTMDTIIMYEQFYQTRHHKRLLGGNTSRNPEFKFQYFTEAPVINSIIALETGHEIEPATLEQDRALAPQVMAFFRVRYVVVHRAKAGEPVHQYLRTVLPEGQLVAQEDDIVIYRLPVQEPPDVVLIDLGSDLARLNLGEGWSSADGSADRERISGWSGSADRERISGWSEAADGERISGWREPVDEERMEQIGGWGGVADGEGMERIDGWVWGQRWEVKLFVPLRDGRQRMVFRAFGPGEGQRLRVVVNGQKAGEVLLAEGWGQYELGIPAGYVRPGLNEFRFRFAQLYPVADVRLGDYAIGRTGIISPVSILVKSAGMEVGDFGHIYVNGLNVSPEGRGYNLAVIDPDSGAVEATAAFDTFAAEEESRRLAQFIAAIPEGKIVAVAVRDEASLRLEGEAVEALRTIGATADLRGQFRWGQAIIGVKGAQPGQALERVGLLRPVSVYVGVPVSEPYVAAAFDFMRFEAGSEGP